MFANLSVIDNCTIAPINVLGQNKADVEIRAIELLTKFGLADFINARVSSLSGGQKQRVAIARMLINRYNVLVFDDSLSAVDNETDISIRKSLSNIEDVTTIIITHRITSILDSDLILVLADGKIIEAGSIDELKGQNGYFAAMYKSQVGEISE